MPQETQRPRGPKDLICPLHKAPMSEVCDSCPLWVHIYGKHPQNEQLVDHWDCALAWTPVLLVENSQQQRQTGAAVESFRNEMVKANEASRELIRLELNGKALTHG